MTINEHFAGMIEEMADTQRARGLFWAGADPNEPLGWRQWRDLAKAIRMDLAADAPNSDPVVQGIRDQVRSFDYSAYSTASILGMMGYLLAVIEQRDGAGSAPPPQLHIAEQIAREAHAGQVDKRGEDYIEHVARVVAMVDGEDAKAVAWLHDVVEDTSVSLVDLAIRGIAQPIREAVRELTRVEHQPYEQYIRDVALSGNQLAIAVKVADLRDHLRPNCPVSLRLRYEKALETLTGYACGRLAQDQEQNNG